MISFVPTFNLAFDFKPLALRIASSGTPYRSDKDLIVSSLASVTSVPPSTTHFHHQLTTPRIVHSQQEKTNSPLFVTQPALRTISQRLDYERMLKLHLVPSKARQRSDRYFEPRYRNPQHPQQGLTRYSVISKEIRLFSDRNGPNPQKD